MGRYCLGAFWPLEAGTVVRDAVTSNIELPDDTVKELKLRIFSLYCVWAVGLMFAVGLIYVSCNKLHILTPSLCSSLNNQLGYISVLV